jgi:hypothetical protein
MLKYIKPVITVKINKTILNLTSLYLSTTNFAQSRIKLTQCDKIPATISGHGGGTVIWLSRDYAGLSLTVEEYMYFAPL